jgi:hypothetical protein
MMRFPQAGSFGLFPLLYPCKRQDRREYRYQDEYGGCEPKAARRFEAKPIQFGQPRENAKGWKLKLAP